MERQKQPVDNNEREIIKKLAETESRAKSNTKQIEEIKEDIKQLYNEEKILYKLTNSIELIAQEMTTIKTSISKIEADQESLSNKVEKIEHKPFEEYEETKKELKNKLFVNIGSGIISGAIIGLGMVGIIIGYLMNNGYIAF